MSASDIQNVAPQIESETTPKTAPQVAQNGIATDTTLSVEATSTTDNAATADFNGAPAEKQADNQAESTQNDGVAADSSEVIEAAPESDASLEIDQRRAKQLLDRAMLLSERGDLAGAILAARQAVSLVPNEPSGYSMLGLLHERAGDLEKAITAYEKVVHLAPHSTLERDSLDRLKSTLESENSSVLFHFDDNELFEEPPALPVNDSAASEERETVGAIGTVDAKSASSSASSAAMGVTSVGVTAAVPVAPVGNTIGSPSNRVAASAVVGNSSPSVTPSGLDPLLNSALTARPVSGPPSVLPMTMPAMAQRPSLGLLMRQPSFYFKGAPVVAATTLGLLFMGWAQGVSQNKFLEELPVSPTPRAQTQVLTPREDPQTGVATAANGGNVTGSAPTPASGIVTTTGGGIFGTGNANNPAAPSAPVTSTTRTGGTTTSGTTSGATSGARSAGATGSTGASGSTGVQPLLPSLASPVIPQPRGAAGSSSGPGAMEALPPLQPRRQPQEPVRPSAPSAQPATPSATGDNSGANTTGTSTGGGLFNPNSSPRGYIRIDPVRPSNPVRPVARPGNEARAAENAASRAGATGRAEDVVPNLNRAIERQPTGYVYQRRAMAFMEKGDYARAADDFQSAISAYQDQIRQNQNVEDARNGIQACRSGLQLAMSRMGR